ncbi:STAS domain-containing protein (plasmid) [Streptomyces sp. CA-294286]|uniref:STAS domain-containing protein n=1 Tax=Streptomyces sp. CA-294286 TaxID=3240070 RepID=UPI003D8ABE39
MTSPPAPLRLTTSDSAHRVRIQLHGALDHDHADLLLAEVDRRLAARPHLRDLHLHCGQVTSVDSLGLSVLLMVHRRTAAAQVRLHLDDRSERLDRLLDVTGTLEYLTTASSPTAAADSSKAEEQQAAARPTGPESHS